MKRKIALLLASVMTVSMMPMNAFASSSNKFSKTPQTVPNSTVLYEEGMSKLSNALDPITGVPVFDPAPVDSQGNALPLTLPLFTDGTKLIEPDGRDGFDYAMEGSNFVIKPDADTELKPGDQFKVTLSNAQWFFRANMNASVPEVDAGTGLQATAAGDKHTVGQAFQLALASFAGDQDFLDEVGDPNFTEASGAASSVFTKLKKLLGKTGAPDTISDAGLKATSGTPTWYTGAMDAANSTIDLGTNNKLGDYAITYDLKQGLWFPKNNAASTDDGRRAGTYYRLNTAALPTWTADSQQIPYSMYVSDLDPRTATITIEGNPGDRYSQQALANSLGGTVTPGAVESLVLPLVTKTTDENDIKLTINSSLAGVSSGTYVYGVAGSGSTKTTAVDTQTATDEFKVGKIVINERRLQSIESNGSVAITAPSGFHWTHVDTAKVFADPGLAWGTSPNANESTEGKRYAGTIGGINYNVNTVIHNLFWYQRNSMTDISTTAGRKDMSARILPGYDYALGYDYDEDSHTSTSTGNANHGNTIADHYDTDDSTIVLSVNNLQRSTKVTGALYITGLSLVADEDVAAGDIKCTIADVDNDELNVSDDTFVAGTLALANIKLSAEKVTDLVAGRYTTMDSANFDRDTKAAHVIFEETAPNAWWSGRTTTFTLPEGVKFRKVDITDVDNVDQGDNLKDDSDEYINDGKKLGYVKIDGNVMTFEHLSVPHDDNQRAKIQFNVWLSISADYATGATSKDVKLTVGGTGVTTPQSTTIARVISPVTVTTAVSNIKIGYQLQKTGDITITENKAGVLLKGKVVRVSVSDLVSTDVWFSPDIAVNVEKADGSLAIKNISTSTSGSAKSGTLTNSTNAGQISFEIDKASSKASTIKITNVSVKVDRTVPVTNDRNYKVYVWGNAVAENFDATTTAARDEFNKPGVSADYIAVTTASPDDTSVLASEVRVTIGEKYYTVNGQTTEMDAAAYISPVSHSTMVPVRFVANAFGIKDDQIMYDNATHTVTLIHPTRVVQFTTGSNKMLVNGANTPMYSLDTPPVPVSAENTDGRVYIPLRALGNAFGISTDWDAATNTAIYNKGANKTVAATIATPDAAPAATTTAQ